MVESDEGSDLLHRLYRNCQAINPRAVFKASAYERSQRSRTKVVTQNTSAYASAPNACPEKNAPMRAPGT